MIYYLPYMAYYFLCEALVYPLYRVCIYPLFKVCMLPPAPAANLRPCLNCVVSERESSSNYRTMETVKKHVSRCRYHVTARFQFRLLNRNSLQHLNCDSCCCCCASIFLLCRHEIALPQVLIRTTTMYNVPCMVPSIIILHLSILVSTIGMSHTNW